MGNRKRVKKRSKNQEVEASMSSTISMSTSIGQSDTTHNEIEGEHSSKKINRAEDLSNVGAEAGPSQNRSRGQGQGRGSSLEKVSMDNLPPEMLTKILKSVDTGSLFKCRLVNWNLCGVSTEVLTTRRDCHLKFTDRGGVLQINCAADVQRLSLRSKKTTLEDFVKCMKKSKNCPYSRFSFKINLRLFESREWTGFLSSCSNKMDSSNKNPNKNENQNQKIRINYLDLDVCGLYTFVCYHILTEKLGNLIVNEIPDLKEFRLDFSIPDDLDSACAFDDEVVDIRSLKLFPPSQNTEPEAERETGKTQVVVPVQLPHLKVLELPIWMFERVPGIIGDLLNAAVNLKTILANDRGKRSREFSLMEAFQLLFSLGKINLSETLTLTP